jgi:hypothetical protein
MKRLFPVICVFSCLIAARSFAGSATWNLNPTSSDWNTATNWTPNTVPNGPADVATFAISNQTSVTLVDEYVHLDRIVFDTNASPFTLTCMPFAHFEMEGAGQINNSGVDQTFVTESIAGSWGSRLLQQRERGGQLYHLHQRHRRWRVAMLHGLFWQRDGRQRDFHE